jgi:thiol:disulfide interchange protein DsbD
MMRVKCYRQAAILVLVVAGVIGTGAPAVPPTPAHWTITGLPHKPINAGATFVLTLVARIDPGWHIYAQEEPEGGPIPTVIGLAKQDPLTLVSIDEPQPRMVADPVLRQPVGMFQDKVSFQLRVRAPLGPRSADAVSHILVRYQSCNDQLCLPPHLEDLRLPLKDIIK